MTDGVGKLLGQFRDVQGRMKRMQEEMAREEITGSSGGNMVKVTINGKFQIVDVRLDRKILEEGELSLIEDMVAAAVNSATNKMQERLKQKMGELTGGLNPSEMGIPGLL